MAKIGYSYDAREIVKQKPARYCEGV